MRLVIIFFLSSTYFFSQNPTKLIDVKNSLIQEIELSKKTLESSKKQKKISLDELQALSAYIELRENLKSTIIQQKDSIELYKKEIEEKIKNIEEKKLTAQNAYAQLIKSIYFNEFEINLIDFIFSKDSFKSAIDSYIYYKEQENLRQNLFTELEFLKNQLIIFRENLNNNILLKDTLINEFNIEKDSLTILKIEKERITSDLSRKEKELSKYILNKQEEARRVELEIIEIQKQIKERSLSGSNEFKKNQNKLIWPVDKGILLSPFGEVNHKNLPGIKIINNGVEIGVEKNATIRSIFNGTVTKIIIMPNGLKAVIIRHGEYLSVYSNLFDTYIQVGQKVITKQPIGVVFTKKEDNSGVLDFQIWKGLEKINPMNWLKSNSE